MGSLSSGAATKGIYDQVFRQFQTNQDDQFSLNITPAYYNTTKVNNILFVLKGVL